MFIDTFKSFSLTFYCYYSVAHHFSIFSSENCDRRLRPLAAFSSPRSQFFTIRTDPQQALFFLAVNWLTSGFCH